MSGETKIDDASLIEMIRNDNTRDKGFRLLLQNYQEKLYWHVRRMVHEHDDANDVLQETFVKVYKYLHNFKGDSKLFTWLYRIASNECLTYLKKQQKHRSSSLDNDENSLENQLEADSFFEGDEAMIILKKAIETLPEKQKLVFNMKYFDAMSYKDISEVLGTSVGGLKASYFHASQKIEAYVKNKFN